MAMDLPERGRYVKVDNHPFRSAYYGS